MTTFNVLEREQSVHRHAFLEASAGTGKTYAIENIVSRLITDDEQEPLTIDKILIVTFTRAATRELKDRIRNKLSSNLSLLKTAQSNGECVKGMPDYLAAHIERGYDAIKKAIRHIEQALLSFDHAQIFTIHSFCWRMLKNYAMEAKISLETTCREDQTLDMALLNQVVRDFLLTQLTMPEYSPQQLKILASRFKNDSDSLISSLLKEVSKGLEVFPTRSFDKLFVEFQRCMSSLNLEPEKLREDLLIHAQSYKLHNMKKELKPEFVKAIELFSCFFESSSWTTDDFELLIENGLITDSFSEENRRSKPLSTAKSSLHYPTLIESIKTSLAPIINEARSSSSIYSRVVADCVSFVRKYQEQEEMFGHNDLLHKMRTAINNAPFAERIRKMYSAVIVDEFQDTDPIQWEIFSQLFANEDVWKGYMILVGDPKQSIYAFRQADIYTYLSAINKLGHDAHATLSTNYRSVPLLVDAINALFKTGKGIFSLPRFSQELPYKEVRAGITDSVNKQPCLQFLAVTHESSARDPVKEVESFYLFPAIADEILRLHESESIPFKHNAILVADRHQARRLTAYLKQRNIGVKAQKGKDLSNSSVVDSLRELLTGILNFHSRSSLAVALGGRLIGMTHAELQALEDESKMVKILIQCEQLRVTLNQHGFASFFQQFMQTSWHEDKKSVCEKLLNAYEGHELYRLLQDLADLLIEEEHERDLHPFGLIGYLDNLQLSRAQDSDSLESYIDLDVDGVSILTTHISKGLEFENVFALGLINRSRLSEHDLIPIIKGDKTILYAAKSDDDPLYKQHCEESDAEKLRQLYVALTRAKSKLYVPVINYINKKSVPFGTASPMELLLGRMKCLSNNYLDLYRCIESEDGSTLNMLVENNPALMQVRTLPYVDSRSVNTFKPTIIAIHPPKQITVSSTEQVVQSYSSLVSSKSVPPIENDSQMSPPHDFFISEKNEHTLPSGNEIGILLHSILEILPFSCVNEYQGPEDFQDAISPFVSQTRFAPWKEVISNIVFKALRTPMPGGFTLADVPLEKTYRETEFIYPYDQARQTFDVLNIKAGFLKGVIDLFFEHNGKYYLLDWKSNWLGPSHEYYSQPHLMKAMSDNSYHLQASVYMQAMQRYLKLFDPRPFDAIFGGTFYIFLRGVGPNSGVLLIPPSSLESNLC